MNDSDLSALTLFARVAEEQSFSAAAQALGISNSVASYTIRRLEQQLGTKLFNRTTRSVSLTEAGSAFLTRIQPLMEQLDLAFSEVGRASSETMGTLRLNMLRSAIPLVINPILKDFLQAYPDIKIDVISDNSLVDIASKGYDAGIRYDNVMAQDMVAIPVVSDMRFCIVASPDYLEGKALPEHPRDLLKHDCINYRSADTQALYRWEFEKGDEKISVSVTGRIATNDNDLLLQAALDGLGFGYLQHRLVEPHLNSGRLVNVLDEWIPRGALYLYYYNPNGLPRKLRVFIDFVRERLK
ncbi:LysR family transcriptional regulator [Paraburkholderia sp. DHOC27]|uniref:LysR family transcriptional regulator n=1 Tax=Paraburkholderia sp. DHOC27 TaxID=2303330 RepID=UPI000E3E2595|nr:LysR family transcriptional regulator [Paraburkholderia sp. DHOC27]RFU43998.1 LysR family transcriptional regulator [Paraburkholderia sp. DHOC27]